MRDRGSRQVHPRIRSPPGRRRRNKVNDRKRRSRASLWEGRGGAGENGRGGQSTSGDPFARGGAGERKYGPPARKKSDPPPLQRGRKSGGLGGAPRTRMQPPPRAAAKRTTQGAAKKWYECDPSEGNGSRHALSPWEPDPQGGERAVDFKTRQVEGTKL